MADSVSRLKELLFQQEAASLADMARRIEDLASVERQARAELAETGRQVEGRIAQSVRELDARLAELNKRTGTPEALRSSVAEVIDDVIIEARQKKQEDLSRALAPMMIKTIKAELKNNQAEMVEALYPITGQLVKSYVASAMKELRNKMNRGLQDHPVMLRFRSLFSRYTAAELALGDSEHLNVEELYLIRRGSGELLQRWPVSAGRANSDAHMTGVLSAINDFSAQAFQSDGGHLRSFDLDDFTVFLRASPIYLLAAKCRGTAAPGVDKLIDDEFLEAVSRQHAGASSAGEVTGHDGADSGPPQQLLADLKSRLESGINDKHQELSTAGLPFNPLRALTALAVLAIAGGVGWYGWTTWEVETTRARAQTAIAASDGMRGYPVTVEVGARGQSLSISGVAPSLSAKGQLLGNLSGELPAVKIEEKGLAVLPASGPDLTPQLAEVRRDLGGVQSAVRTDLGSLETTIKRELATLERQMAHKAAVRSLGRAQRRIEEALPDLKALAVQRAGSASAALTEAENALGAIKAQSALLESSDPSPAIQASSAAALMQGTRQILAAAAGFSTQIGQPSPVQRAPAKAATAGVTGGRIAEAAEDISLAAERLASVAAAAIQIAPPTPRERFKTFAAANAVFFANNEEYRDIGTTQRTLAEIARLTKEFAGVVRIIGYTDERGAQSRNNPLAQARADKVAAALVSLGVPRNRIVAVGRSAGPDISPAVGPESANRRVEFELGFEGEAAANP